LRAGKFVRPQSGGLQHTRKSRQPGQTTVAGLRDENRYLSLFIGFFIDGVMRRWLGFAKRYGWPVVHAGRVWDKPGVCEFRQVTVFVGVLSLLMMLVFML
jgi:hypothetical protein